MAEPHTDIAIIGGGPAGASAAIHLARAGRAVTLLEREAEPAPKVCGEFLAAPALTELSALGIDPAALGAANIARVHLATSRRSAVAALPFPAASLTRERLDAHLLARAGAAGATVSRGARVRTATRSGPVWRVDMGSRALAANTVVIATGKLDLRAHPRGEGHHRGLTGLKAYVRLTPAARAALGDGVDVLLFPGGYCGVEATEHTAENAAPPSAAQATVNACLVVPSSRLAAGATPADIFAELARASPRANALFDGATIAGRIHAIGRIPYGYVRRHTDGAYYVGDQAAVIPSFCGEGIGIALTSGRLAAEAILAGTPAAAFQRGCARRVGPRVLAATALSRALCSPWLAEVALGLAGYAPALTRLVAATARTPTDRPRQTARR